MTRIQEWYEELKNEGLKDYEIASGILTGDIKTPEWLSYRDNGDEMIIWDNEQGDGGVGVIYLEDDYEEEEN